MQFLLIFFIGYVLGSIPFGVLIAKRYGYDILKEGSGNPGATNVKRVVGKKAGNCVFVLDFFKGALAVWLPVFIFPIKVGGNNGQAYFYLSVLGLVGAVLGHSFSVFIRFRGGKGVATTIGGLVVIMPKGVLVGLGLWAIVFYATRYVSAASIVFGLSLPISAYFFQKKIEWVLFASFIALFILLRHRANIKRLLTGKENRFDKK